MPLSNLLKSAAGTCHFCKQKAGIISREHPECRRTHQAGWNEMVELAADAARSHEFNPNSLQVSLAEIARRSFGDGTTVNQALEEGWRRAVRQWTPQQTGASLTKRNSDSGGSGTGWD